MPGIKGMRWGIRRDPGPDGLVTTPDHLGVRDRTSQSKNRGSPEYRRARVIGRKSVSDMTNEELRSYIDRISLEKTYRDIQAGTINSGKRFSKRLLGEIGKDTLRTAANLTISKTLRNLLDKN